MKIAICISGFPRYIYSTEILQASLLRALPKDIEQVDIFWACPTLLVPDAKDKFNTQELVDAYKSLGLGNVVFSFFEYEPQKFLDKALQLRFSLEDLMNAPKSHSARLSFFYNISQSVKLVHSYVEEKSIQYDWVLITRNDLLPYIKYFGIEKTLERGIYNYRTSPYITNYHQVNLGYVDRGITIDLLDSEDRAIFGSPEYMYEFRFLYDDVDKVFLKPYYYLEVLLTQFIINRFGKEACRYIPNSRIEFPEIPNSYQAKEITQDELKYLKDNLKQ